MIRRIDAPRSKKTLIFIIISDQAHKQTLELNAQNEPFSHLIFTISVGGSFGVQFSRHLELAEYLAIVSEHCWEASIGMKLVALMMTVVTMTTTMFI